MVGRQPIWVLRQATQVSRQVNRKTDPTKILFEHPRNEFQALGKILNILKGQCEKMGQCKKKSQFGKLKMQLSQCGVDNLGMWNFSKTLAIGVEDLAMWNWEWINVELAT